MCELIHIAALQPFANAARGLDLTFAAFSRFGDSIHKPHSLCRAGMGFCCAHLSCFIDTLTSRASIGRRPHKSP